jgi:hypothetical protein
VTADQAKGLIENDQINKQLRAALQCGLLTVALDRLASMVTAAPGRARADGLLPSDGGGE